VLSGPDGAAPGDVRSVVQGNNAIAFDVYARLRAKAGKTGSILFARGGDHVQ
jgi:hypothetical protein